VEVLRYPDEGHKISKLGNRVDSFTKMAEFLARYL
jgi:dipeptidyl aminopeptidase/acylaminoacyl peptidase